jgi:hypothetical protein
MRYGVGMQIERTSGIEKRNFEKVTLEDLHEITIAYEAASRAIRRTPGYIGRRYPTQNFYLNYYVAQPASRLWNYGVALAGSDIRPLRQTQQSMFEVIRSAAYDDAAYVDFFPKEGVTSTADHYSCTMQQGRQPDALVRAVGTYFEPNKSGAEFTENWLIDEDTLCRMVGKASIALEEVRLEESEIWANS